MKPKHFLALFDEAATDLTSGGGASVSEPAAAAETAATEQAPAAEVKEPSWLEKIHAATKDKATLVSENKLLTERASLAEAALATATAELATARERIAALEGEQKQALELIEKSAAESKTVEEAAAAQVASIGFPAADLPAGAKAGDTKEEIENELSHCTDNARRYELAGKLAKASGIALAN